ncbi:hypothetical protein Fcan01_15618 [Folsomia candida]|uniref:Uncharacterized protein n=1 Tax=Folsomia candida TaxID=158441 RepID=A0A226DW22_FOLCA|nr:hypothetical protein Fcan01_15618 [Folsomia candida]
MELKQPLILVLLLTSSFLILSLSFWIFDLNNNIPIVLRCDMNDLVEKETEKSNQTGENFDYPEFFRVDGRITKFFNQTGNNANFSNFNELIPYLVYNATFYNVTPTIAILFYYECINNTKEKIIFTTEMDELYPEFYATRRNIVESKGGDEVKYFRDEEKRDIFYFRLLLLNSSAQLVFGTLIAITYLLLWERHSLHGHLQLCYVLSEAVYRTGKLIYLAIFLNGIRSTQFSYNRKYLQNCAKFDTFSAYNYNAKLLWLTLLVYDLWKTFGNGIVLPGSRKSKFVKHFAFAILSPAVYTCAGLILQTTVWGYDCSMLLYRRNKMVSQILGNAPSIILFACNLFFVISCYRKSKMMQKEGEFAQRNVTSRTDSSSRYKSTILALVTIRVCYPGFWGLG